MMLGFSLWGNITKKLIVSTNFAQEKLGKWTTMARLQLMFKKVWLFYLIATSFGVVCSIAYIVYECHVFCSNGGKLHKCIHHFNCKGQSGATILFLNKGSKNLEHCKNINFILF